MTTSQGPFEPERSLPSDAGNLQQALNDTLEDGERLIWSGFPRQGLMLRAQDVFLIPFSLLWCGFAIFWEFSAVSAPRALVFFDLWGLMFVCVGLYFVFGRFISDAAVRAKTIYGLTNQRVLIMSGWWSRNVRSLELVGLSEINISEKTDGAGTITFGPTGFNGGLGRGWPGNNRYASPALEGIPKARAVLKMIRDTQKALGRPGS
jgi:hypothetical protein